MTVQFHQAVGSTLVYCYMCTNVVLINSSTSAAPWIAYESRFNLWNHDDRIRVKRYSGERCPPKCVIERHRGLTSGVTAQHLQLLPWPAYSPDISPFEPVWDLVGRRLERDPRPAASNDELLLRIQAI
ncbi:transposable element Tcb2 transposase [Trichonephila clavipes]|nr:transposable element Tcb2 transposase [Trichonephila clavipes]